MFYILVEYPNYFQIQDGPIRIGILNIFVIFENIKKNIYQYELTRSTDSNDIFVGKGILEILRSSSLLIHVNINVRQF